MAEIPIVVLGAGPAGLGATLKLARRGGFKVTVVERSDRVGGNAGSFDIAGMRVDFGSHRLHPSCRPDILNDIRSMLRDDLLERPRHGRIFLKGRWVHFPLKLADLLRNLPLSFSSGVALDALSKPFAPDGPETFAGVLERGLGKTICREFYFPYARKIWGVQPDELDAIQARRRVSAGSLGKMVRKVLSSVPGFKPQGAGRFFYPRRGFGEISEQYRQAAESAGAKVRLGSEVVGVECDSGRVSAVVMRREGEESRLPAKQVLSTIPLPALVRAMRPAAPVAVSESAARLRSRGMILVYLVLATGQFTEYDAHYFPDPAVPITRLSEPKNYGLAEAPGRTVLCAELPCNPDDPEWSASDGDLQGVLERALAQAGLPVWAAIEGCEVRRLPHAYPVYVRGYNDHFKRVDEWIGGIEGLITLGRQGLFAHDNTHHTLAMAYDAVSSLSDAGELDKEAWARHRVEFETHVVED